MTQDGESAEQTSPDDLKKKKRALKHLRQLGEHEDHVLGPLLQLVLGKDSDSVSGTFSLTVSIRGTVVSGTVVSESVWRQALVEQLRTAGLEVADQFSDMLTQWSDMESKKNAERIRLDLWSAPHLYVHFKNATVAQGAATGTYPLWRADVRQIDGWSLSAR